MPIYEYQCDDCGKVEEVFQKFSDKPLTKCNHCSGKLHKLISHSTFHLKGSGWYVTDYSDKKQAKDKTASNTVEAKDKGSKPAADTHVKKPAAIDPQSG